ncbi:AAA family ATPase [Candidatus Cyanaurora vandensis]|uniref:AAA family ATPase n=1 Tax=Candidatus Cyanaurora vandensis TaxID=2714958 RepID=UPI00257C68A4|nr:AAA family ATPase [Candidatus Cyanaurora vandensis]
MSTTVLRTEQQPAFLERVRLYAQRRVLWLRCLWSQDGLEPDQGLAISHGEVDRILSEPHALAQEEALFYDQDPACRYLSLRVQETEAALAQDERWQQLGALFDLSPWEADFLALALAVAVDPLLRRVYGYLQDDATASQATLWLAQGLFRWPVGTQLTPASALIRWRLVTTSQPWTLTSPWTVDPWLWLWLQDSRVLDPQLGTAVQWAFAEETCLYPEQLQHIQKFVKAFPAQQPLAVQLIGPEGAGKCTLAAQFARPRPLLSVNAGALLGGETALTEERVVRAVRQARLAGACVHWHHTESVPPRVWRILTGPGVMFWGAEAPLQPLNQPTTVVHLPALTQETRLDLWTRLTGEATAPQPITDWVLTPGELAAAARVARAGSEAVRAYCRQQYQGPGELFSPLPCPYTWADLVLAPTVQQRLQELETQAQLRWQVYEQWGFGRLCPLGKGITALFAGPSGTGKTMSAQVIAQSLGLELYRVDLAGVVNKYIGETEKRLRQVFAACERANVLLFFDEADALFGQRTQVKDAHDRFANIEIDYLLQRMEQFDGIAILATNRKGDLDQAFLRRIRFIVDFLPPGPGERLALWQRALVPKAPNGEQLLDPLDWDFLAQKLPLTGADIKSAALNAAFLARAQGTRISMQHVLAAARRELDKHGIVMRTSEWDPSKREVK